MIKKEVNNMNIHPTAIVHQDAQISPSAEIGPYCIIGPNVTIADSVVLRSHVCIDAHTTIGEGTEIFPFVSIGSKPQDLKFKGEASEIIIGKNNSIREYVTIHQGTKDGIMKTVIGDGCLLMVGVHVAHDCMVGNNVIMANNATLAGHVEIEDGAILGGMSAYHQFVKIGRNAIIGGGSIVVDNVIPFANVRGERAFVNGLNLVGLKRSGLSRKEISALQKAYDEIFAGEGETLEQRVESAYHRYGDNDLVQELVDFIKADHKRPLCLPQK
jgi:UDP-N-acetylglucosamine acyltransferase